MDAVVSFETLEHFFEHDRFIAEVARVLRPAGCLIVSSPERDVYSPSGSPANPHHVLELSSNELEALLRKTFSHVQVLSQRPMIGSAIISDRALGGQAITFERRGARHFEQNHGLPRPPYVIAIASREPLPPISESLFIESSEVGQVLSTVAAFDALREELARIREASISKEVATRLESDLEAARTERDALRAALRRKATPMSKAAGVADLEILMRRSWV